MFYMTKYGGYNSITKIDPERRLFKNNQYASKHFDIIVKHVLYKKERYTSSLFDKNVFDSRKFSFNEQSSARITKEHIFVLDVGHH